MGCIYRGFVIPLPANIRGEKNVPFPLFMSACQSPCVTNSQNECSMLPFFSCRSALSSPARCRISTQRQETM